MKDSSYKSSAFRISSRKQKILVPTAFVGGHVRCRLKTFGSQLARNLRPNWQWRSLQLVENVEHHSIGSGREENYVRDSAEPGALNQHKRDCSFQLRANNRALDQSATHP